MLGDFMECPFCADMPDIEAWDADIVEHLVITIDAEGRGHVHGPVDEPKKMEALLSLARKETVFPEHKKKHWGKVPRQRQKGEA